MSDNNQQDENPIFGMIQHALDRDYNKANDVFGNMMTIKQSDLLSQEKVRLAGEIYNGQTPEDEDENDVEEDQLELDLETEDDDEEEETGDDEEEDEDLLSDEEIDDLLDDEENLEN